MVAIKYDNMIIIKITTQFDLVGDKTQKEIIK